MSPKWQLHKDCGAPWKFHHERREFNSGEFYLECPRPRLTNLPGVNFSVCAGCTMPFPFTGTNAPARCSMCAADPTWQEKP